MTRSRVLLGLVVVAFLTGGFLSGDEPKKEAPAKGRASLPANWSKLGLTDTQKQDVYKIRGEFGAKIDALRQQIRDLQNEERQALAKVLTDAQKQRLREIAAEKVPGDSKKESDKSSPDKKP
jgi:hypothetical protein